nr:polymerase [Chuviridae sp.]
MLFYLYESLLFYLLVCFAAMAYRAEEHGQRTIPGSVTDIVFDRKFNVALRKSHGDTFKAGLDVGPLNDDDKVLYQLVVRSYPPPPGMALEFRVNVNLFPRLYMDICELSPTGQYYKDRIWGLVERSTVVQLEWLTHRWSYPVDPQLTRRIHGLLSTASRGLLINQLANELTTLTPLVDRSGRATRFRQKTENEDDFYRRLMMTNKTTIMTAKHPIVWSNHSCAIRYRDIWYYFSKPYILLIHNKISDILSVLVYAALSPYETYRWNLYTITTEFLYSWAECASELNQDFFRVSKLLEAVGIGLTLQETEGESNEQFLLTVNRGAYKHTGRTLSSFRFYRIMERASIEVRHELMCLSKVMGHPFCDIDAGAADLHAKVTAEKELDSKFIKESVRRAKEDFVKHYHRRHGKWPLCKIDPRLPRRIASMILRNKSPFDPAVIRRHGAITLEQYDLIELLPIKEFDWVDNMLPHLKDRTISAKRSAVFRHYIEKEKPGIPWADTRLLLFYMLSPKDMIDHIRYLRDYMAGRWELLQDYLIIRIVPKEKEHKIEARGFGCKTHQDRARSIIQEHNTAGILNAYSSEHVMTLDELALAKKLLAFRHMTRAYRGYRMVIVSVDASAWNNAFRAEALHPMMEETLDALHGVKFWNKTQTAYEQSYIYMPDVDKIHAWEGQAGGIEGLNQYTWVYAYIHQMKVCMREQPYPYYILCKGDDLRLAVLVSPELLEGSSIDIIKQNLLESVSRIGRKFGHTIKIEDSYASESYFAFSKDAYVNGVEQSQGMRKIQKCYGANNAFLNIMDDYIASAFSNAHSACKVCPSPVTAYMVGLWWAFYAMLNARPYRDMSDDQLTALSLIPNVLGGFPVIYLHNMFVRAESDLLPPFLDLCAYTRDHYPSLHVCLMRAWCQRTSPAEKSLSGLMIDIYSLPIARPRTAPSVLRSEMITFLSDFTKNDDLIRLFRARSKGLGAAMLRSFASANVYNAKLMGALYGCTPEQITDELVRKFETGKSIYLALLRHRGYRRTMTIMRRVNLADRNMHRYRQGLLDSAVRHPPSILPENWYGRCPGEVCDQLRAELWGKPVTGVTQPPPQHQLFGGWIERVPPTAYNLRFHFELWHTHPSGELPHLFSIGPNTPFIGARTGKGLAKPKAELNTPSVFTDKIRVILEVYQWSRVATIDGRVGNLHQLCISLLRDYTGREVEEFIPYAGDTYYHKTVQHHVRANTYRAHIVPNTLLNIYTTMRGNIYAHQYFKTSIDHYRVNYLQAFTYMVSLTVLPWWCGDGQKLTPRVWGVTTECNWCLRALFEIPVVVEEVELPEANLAGVLRISPNDIQRIIDELDALEMPEMYTPPEEVDENILSISKQGLCEYLITNMWAHKVTVQLASSQHHMSGLAADTVAAWLGTSIGAPVSVQDIRCVGAEALIMGVASMVRYYILTAFPYPSDEQCLAAMASTPAEQLPWYCFLQTLSEAFLTYEVQRIMRELCPDTSLVSVDSARGLTHQFGHFCFTYTRLPSRTRRLIVLSYREDVMIPRALQLRIESLRWTVLDTTVGAALHEARRVGERNLIIALTEAILALSLTDEEQFKAQIPQVGQNNPLASLFPPVADVGEFLAQDFIWRDDCNHPSVTEPILANYYEFYVPADFVELVVRRYSIGWVTMQVFIHSIYQDGPRYEAAHAAALLQVGDPKVEIVHLDPVTCLNNVKQAAESEPMVDTPLYASDSVPNFIMRAPLAPHITMRTGRVASSHELCRIDATTDRVAQAVNPLLVEASCIRTSGVGNQSMSKMLWLFQSLRIPNIADESIVMCLGDGYGGMTAVTNVMTRNSTIVYNTLPTTLFSVPQPLECQHLAQVYNNKIEISDIELGVYDLTSPMLIDVFCHRYSGVDMVLCDAETPLLTGGRYAAARRAIIQNVAVLYVRASKPGSLLILKVYAREWELWASTFQSLLTVCEPVRLVHNLCSYHDGECYITAYLTVPDPQWKITLDEYPPLIPSRQVERFFQRMIQRYIDDQEAEGPLMATSKYSEHFAELVAQLPCWGWSKVIEVVKLDIPSPIRKPVIQPALWARDALAYLRRQKDRIIDDIKHGPRGSQAYSYDTVTHAVMLIERLSMLQAIDWCIVTCITERRALVEGEGRENLLGVLHTLPIRYGLRACTSENITEHNSILRVESQIYSCWRQAVRWGISILIYNLCNWGREEY